jgi:glycosyltransferase involved in cell wall biosynthesis
MLSFYFHPDYSGSAVQAHNLSRHLQRLGVQPFILSANLSDSPAYELVDGVPVHRLPVVRSGEMRVPSFAAAAARFLISHRREFDLVHAHGTLQHGVASIIGRILRKPSILKVAMVNSDIAFANHGRLAGRLNRLMVNRFDRYIATTPAIAAEFGERRLDTRRVRLIPNGVDTSLFSPAACSAKADLRRRLGLADGPLVTCVAIINERKNIDGVLRIWNGVVKRGLPGHLALVGPVHNPHGAFHRRLMDYVEAEGLHERVSFVGRVEPVFPYLKASDVFIFPSRQEGMPNGVLEAMSCGLPCLVSRSAGTSEIVTHHVDGYALETNDEAGFTDALASLVASEPLRHAIGSRARDKMIARFSLETIAARYAELYQELLHA